MFVLRKASVLDADYPPIGAGMHSGTVPVREEHLKDIDHLVCSTHYLALLQVNIESFLFGGK